MPQVSKSCRTILSGFYEPEAAPLPTRRRPKAARSVSLHAKIPFAARRDAQANLAWSCPLRSGSARCSPVGFRARLAAIADFCRCHHATALWLAATKCLGCTSCFPRRLAGRERASQAAKASFSLPHAGRAAHCAGARQNCTNLDWNSPLKGQGVIQWVFLTQRGQRDTVSCPGESCRAQRYSGRAPLRQRDVRQREIRLQFQK